ncbi:MAG: DUF3107 domain-containing protein [Actinobacteria bacterium]|jgi:hypothetical protein|nr:DUF3107 domain-containing protein [Actinomycetota bacterium]
MATKKSSSAHTDIRIGISDSSQELNIESELSADAVLAEVTAALDSGKALTLTDIRGRKTVIAHSKISFVEVGETAERRVGFATA